MNRTEIILLVVFCVLFAGSAVVEKIFRKKMYDAADVKDAARSVKKNKASVCRTVFSVLMLVFGALIMCILILTGASHRAQLLASAAMLLAALI